MHTEINNDSHDQRIIATLIDVMMVGTSLLSQMQKLTNSQYNFLHNRLENKSAISEISFFLVRELRFGNNSGTDAKRSIVLCKS